MSTDITLHLKPDSERLLREVLQRRRPDLLEWLSPAVAISRREIEALILVVADEFSATGLRPDSEPNARGLVLQELIDELNHYGFQ